MQRKGKNIMNKLKIIENAPRNNRTCGNQCIDCSTDDYLLVPGIEVDGSWFCNKHCAHSAHLELSEGDFTPFPELDNRSQDQINECRNENYWRNQN